MLMNLIDPSPALLRSQPRDPEQWAIAASGSYAIGIDNVSSITPWWSDALCKACTGDGWVRRKLYSDSDLSVLSFRRVMLLTSIDAGALRGDLGDRLLLVDLDRIEEGARRPESEIDRHFNELYPQAFGALLTLVSDVLRHLPHAHPKSLPRMADFGRVLAALDAADGDGGISLGIYMGQGKRIAGDVLDADAVANALIAMIESEQEWSGTAGDLLVRLTPERPPTGWPKSPRGMAGHLKRLLPALRATGIEVEYDRSTSRDRRREYFIRHRQQSTVQTGHASGERLSGGSDGPYLSDSGEAA
jgi:hypothetical protein